MIGQIRQSFEEAVMLDDGSFAGGTTVVHETQGAPTVSLQAGLSWTYWRHGYWNRFLLGYEMEQWWYLGQVGASRAELLSQGIFFRGEIGF